MRIFKAVPDFRRPQYKILVMNQPMVQLLLPADESEKREQGRISLGVDLVVVGLVEVGLVEAVCPQEARLVALC